MKRITNYMKYILPMVFFATLISCDKETEDPDKPYVGKWQTAVYPSLSLQGAQIVEQMTLNLTNTTFEDKIQQGADEGSLQFASAIKGIITNPTESTIHIEINELSIIEGIYISKESNPDDFQTTWNATLGNLLNEEFDAQFILDGDKMKMILPVKYMEQEMNDTLNLNKIN